MTRRRVIASLYHGPLLFAATALIPMRPSLSWAAAATGPFGAGLPDGDIPGETFFPRLASTIISIQFYFNQHMTMAVHAIRHDASAVWTLLALSFAYGIVHAAGPGHGKAVVSSYLLATRQTLRNGIALAFIASLAQAGGAIALILVASLLLHMTSVSITLATFQFEILSNVLIVLLGCWLVWTKIIRPARPLQLNFEPVNAWTRPERYLATATAPGSSRFQAHDTTAPALPASRSRAPALATLHCHHDNCGHLHMPDATVAAGSLDWRKAWTVIASTALRPCTGALIVLVFSISQGLLVAGLAATLVMGLGTAITVAALAVLAVSARRTAFTLTRADSQLGRKIIRGAEICGALAVLSFGALMLLGNVFLH
jgi:ABC-type nickel/cobalt efflux system permease component RcnA